MTEENEENLPTQEIVLKPISPLRNTKEITIDSDLIELQKSDLEVANAMLSAVHDCWKHVKSLRALTSMVDTTIKATAHRRAVIGKPYGAKSEVSKGNGGAFVPD